MQIKRYATPPKMNKPFFEFKAPEAVNISEEETKISS